MCKYFSKEFTKECKQKQKETCDCCKSFKWLDFVVTDECWATVVSGDINNELGGVFCLNCFIGLANQKNILLGLNDFKNIDFYSLPNKDDIPSLRLL